MIRINLSPTKKKRRSAGTAAAATPGTGSSSQVWMLGMLVGWIVIGGACYWLQTLEEDAANVVRRDAAATNKKADEIKKDIDEEGLKQREQQVEQMKLAKKKLNAKRRTPVFVMYELAMILTNAADGGGPDKDEEKYRQNLKADPQSAINKGWDPTGLWIDAIEQQGTVIALEGRARDASDLSEFTRRLRASARFGEATNPDFQREGNPADDDARYLTWKLNVQVQRWN